MDTSNWLQECERLLRNGQVQLVAQKLKSRVSRKLKLSSRLGFAKLCRRAGLIEHGLRALSPVVRSKVRLRPATPDEISEYAVLLSMSGCQSEALALLNSLPQGHSGEVHLHRAFCHILQWNYSEAIADLEQVSAQADSPYQRLVAQVNLAAAYLYTDRLCEAEATASWGIEACRKEGAQRILGNFLEIRSQICLRRGDSSLALADLDRAEAVLKGSPWDQSFIDKWRLIVTALNNRDLALMQQLKLRAILSGQWESAREADFYQLKIEFSKPLFNQLVLGSPYAAYRTRVQREFGMEPDPYILLSSGSGLGPIFNPSQVERNIGIERPTVKVCQMVSVLARDLYAPQRLGEIFSHLYPGEYFNVDSSLIRVRQAVFRTRQWMNEAGTGFEIMVSKGCHSLRIGGACSLELGTAGPIRNQALAQWTKMDRVFQPGQLFTAQEACRIMGVSQSQFSRYARIMMEEGKLLRFGAGPATSYRVKCAS